MTASPRHPGTSRPVPATLPVGRRSVLRGSLGLIALGAAVPALAACNGRGPTSTVGQLPFDQALPIPPLEEGELEGGTRRFDLTVQDGTSDLVPAGPTPTRGVNGAMLGPTLLARRGDEIRMRVTNELDEDTVLHWHGMELPAIADGGPHQHIHPGSTWEPRWMIDQPAATLWYHPHPHGATERQAYQGIAGMFLITDDEEESLPLPHRYGIDDIPVVVQDKTFDEDGNLVETDASLNGMLGDTVLVNGATAPVLDVQAQLTRLRLLNGSTARSYSFGFEDDRPLRIIGSDGGLLAAPVETTRILLTPGERADVVVGMQPGEQSTLRSYPHDLGIPRTTAGRAGAADELDILLLRAGPDLEASEELPEVLAAIPDPDPVGVSEERPFDLGNNVINNRVMDMDRIDAEIPSGSTEIWSVRNIHTEPHNFHVHGVQFRVLAIDGDAPPPQLAGFKDTVYVAPRQRVRLLLEFPDHPDPEHPYMYHCHLLRHEDAGMMGQFTLVEG
ncbi:MAG: multicopper oxidase domain-containing protein [Brachybacterium sp.]|nr:multicopper oxidase domain-containing protein [Brachybacterium sp.]